MSVPARQLIQRAVKASATAWSGAVLGRLAPSAGLLRHLSVFQAFSGTAEQSSAAFSPAEPAYKVRSKGEGPGLGLLDMEWQARTRLDTWREGTLAPLRERPRASVGPPEELGPQGPVSVWGQRDREVTGAL